MNLEKIFIPYTKRKKLDVVQDDRTHEIADFFHGRQPGTEIAEEGKTIIAHTIANIYRYSCLAGKYFQRVDQAGKAEVFIIH